MLINVTAVAGCLLLLWVAYRMENLMKAIQDFVAAQTAFNTRLSTAVDGLSGDIKTLNDKITELQNSPGTLSPEDQAALDALQTTASGVAEKLEALDALTPPTPPATT